MAKEMSRLPKILRSPIDMLDMSATLMDAADQLEKSAADEGRTVRARPQILRIRSFARELEQSANEKLGSHERRLKG
jgi:hypothetical protein